MTSSRYEPSVYKHTTTQKHRRPMVRNANTNRLQSNRNVFDEATGDKIEEATEGKQYVPADGKRHTIGELAKVAEDRGMTTDQFTRLVIHNGYNESDFNTWLDSRIAACAKPKVLVDIAAIEIHGSSYDARSTLNATDIGAPPPANGSKGGFSGSKGNMRIRKHGEIGTDCDDDERELD